VSPAVGDARAERLSGAGLSFWTRLKPCTQVQSSYRSYRIFERMFVLAHNHLTSFILLTRKLGDRFCTLLD
jgi:hypothetical protein